ncbi:hypothetical protein IFM89_027629, partial [Coptis chinensis]
MFHGRNEGGGEQPLSKIEIHKATFSLQDSASIKASPLVLGSKGENTRWVNVELEYRNASNEDWVGVFSPVNFKHIEDDIRRFGPVGSLVFLYVHCLEEFRDHHTLRFCLSAHWTIGLLFHMSKYYASV